jgi:hypothetical protein
MLLSLSPLGVKNVRLHEWMMLYDTSPLLLLIWQKQIPNITVSPMRKISVLHNDTPLTQQEKHTVKMVFDTIRRHFVGIIKFLELSELPSFCEELISGMTP